MPFSYEYPRPAVTVDVVLFSMRAEDLAVLLIKRKAPPFKGHWALPGGFVNMNEPLERAALRELAEETGVTGVAIEQLGAFGDPGRDPRGHTVSIVYFTFIAGEAHPVTAGDDAAEAAWHPLAALPKMAFDHGDILARARDRLRERLDDPRRASVFEIVPARFTLLELQRVYEAVFGRTLTARTFRARLLKHGIVEPALPARRPRAATKSRAQLYRWRQPSKRR